MNNLATSLSIVAFCAGVIGLLTGCRVLIRGYSEAPKELNSLIFPWVGSLIGMGLWFERDSSIGSMSKLDDSAVLQIISVGVLAAWSGLLILKSGRVGRLKGPIGALVLYGVLGLWSSPLSVAPFFSAFKSISVIVVAIFGACVTSACRRNNKPQYLFNLTYAYFCLLVILSVTCSVFSPELAWRSNAGVFGVMLQGYPYLNSNALGAISAIVASVAFNRAFAVRASAERTCSRCMLVASLLCCVLAQARTSLFGLAFVVLMLTFLVERLKPVRRKVMVFATVVALTVLITGTDRAVFENVISYLSRGNDLATLASLSGRESIWAETMEYITVKPLLGWGFGASGQLGVPVQNSILLVLMNSGIVGVVLWAVFYSRTFLVIKKRLSAASYSCVSRDDLFFAEVAGVFTLMTLRAVTSSSMTLHSYSLAMLVSSLVLVYGAKRADKQLRENYASAKSQ